MRSQKLDFRCPVPVLEAIRLRHERGEYGDYPSFGALQTALNLYASLFPVHHDLTTEIARMKPTEQDAIHDFALRLAKEGRGVDSITQEKPLTARTLLSLARSNS